MQPVLKVLISALLITAGSELGKRNSLAGAFLISLPLTSILALAWLYHDTVAASGDRAAAALKAGAMATDILWLVLPSLVFFVILPWLIRQGWTFWPAMMASMATTAAAYAAFLRVLAAVRPAAG